MLIFSKKVFSVLPYRIPEVPARGASACNIPKTAVAPHLQEATAVLDLGLVSGKLGHVQVVIFSSLSKELLMVSDFYHSALIHNYDLVCITDGG